MYENPVSSHARMKQESAKIFFLALFSCANGLTEDTVVLIDTNYEELNFQERDFLNQKNLPILLLESTNIDAFEDLSNLLVNRIGAVPFVVIGSETMTQQVSTLYENLPGVTKIFMRNQSSLSEQSWRSVPSMSKNINVNTNSRTVLTSFVAGNWIPFTDHLQEFNRLSIRKSRLPESASNLPFIKVSVKGMTPYVIYGKNGELSGVDLDILQALSEKLQFDYEFIRENAWMTKNESGFVNGGIIHTVI